VNRNNINPTVVKWIIGIVIVLILNSMWSSSSCNRNRYDPPQIEDYEYTRDYMREKQMYGEIYDQARKEAYIEDTLNF